ncbi:U2 snRNP-associated SURP domain-containing protein [Blomia tropicalis]|nr:U2 snRNP-associated SURP domain-containing protein [Blomia tropicalis]
MSQVGKIKTFPFGTPPSLTKNKKDLEKQKKLAEEEAAAEAYEEFVATFDTPSKQTAKLFVRGNVINPGSGEDVGAQQSGKLYKPDKLQELERHHHKSSKRDHHQQRSHNVKSASKLSNINEKPPKKKGDEKRKSNLEIFKEELKMMQEEREERNRYRSQGSSKHDQPKPYKSSSFNEDDDSQPRTGSHDTGDPNTTNIYLGNLNPKLTEQQLCETFGKYGPLASVKIMWPRSDEERTRNRNCGFVAFMSRKDGERAMKAINGRNVMNYEMRLGWGKAVPIPPNPIYIPPALRELTLPPPPSGLPFNAQIINDEDRKLLSEKYDNDPQRLFREDRELFDQLLSRTVVRVVSPTERPLLATIHRVIEFVVREGSMFEAMLMSREANNPMFAFLFDNQSPAHIYYRWRLFSVLQGDHPSRWRMKEFRMFKNGSLWRPPPINLYTHGMPEELIPKEDDSNSESDSSDSCDSKKKPIHRQQLHEMDREDLEEMLRSLTPQRSRIADLMIFCIEHADSCDEIIECLADSLCIDDTPLFKKIARLFVVSDILHNCSVKIANVSNYRKGFQSKMEEIFKSFNQTYNSIEGRIKAEHFKQKVMNCFRAWEDTAIYSSEFLIKLQNIFLGLYQPEKNITDKSSLDNQLEDIDGIPIDPDLDGEEMTDMDNESVNGSLTNQFTTKFKPSKWETVDPEVVESQAITSRWENLDKSQSIFPEDDDIDGKPLSDSDYFNALIAQNRQASNQSHEQSSSSSLSLSRDVLRDIELKVVKYQDELEMNARNGIPMKSNESISYMVEKYRSELLMKASGLSESRHSRSRSRSPPKSSSSRNHSYHSSSSSSKKYQSPGRRSRSRSPKRRK